MVHLLHPAFVHFPIALLLVGSVCEAVGHLRGDDRAVRWGGTLTILGTVALLPTIVTGYVAMKSLTVSGEAAPLLDLHELCGWTAAALFTGLLFFRAWNQGAVSAAHRPYYAALLLLGAAVVACGALLGGRLVYVHGVGVGP